MKNYPAPYIVNYLKPFAVLSLAISLSSCSTITSYWPYNKPEKDVAAEAVQIEQDNSEASKYGFQKIDTTVEESILIRQFNLEKFNLDHAITNTKELIAKSFGRPFLPELYIRLAELYAEKSRVVFFLRRLEMGERGKTRTISSVEATGLKEKAVETYMQIISHFPEFEELDRVHFYLAHELRELGKYPEMIKEYETILDNHPSSAFIPESLLLLGDYAYEEKEIDKALGYYHRVLKYPRSSAIVIARYKLAWVHISKRNFKEALALFEQSVTNKNAPSTVDVDTYNRVDIRLEALADMAYSYSQVYKDTAPGDASRYFKEIAWSRQSYMLVLEKLANRYIIKHKWDNAAYIYRELAELQFDGKKLLDYTENLFTSVSESKNYTHSDNDVGLIIKALEHNQYSVHVDEKEKQVLITQYEVYARDIATRLHERAKRSKDVADFKVAADVYEEFLNFFDQSPQLAEITSNYAETLFSSGDFTRAGKIYESIATTIDDPKTKHDPLYSAAVSYYTALGDRESLNYYETAYSQDGLRDVGNTYVTLYPNSSKVPDILFNIARIKYDEGEFDQAVQAFSAFVKRYPQGANAKAAVELMMDAMHLTENYAGLVDLEQKLSKIPQLDAGVKQDLAKVSKASQAKIVQGMIVDSINDWDSGKDKLLDFATNSKTEGMGIQALNALFVSSEEHGDIETMHVAGQSIVSQTPSTPDAENALKALIDLSLTTAQYRALADYLEQYALQFPKSPNAKEFLFQAGQLRSNLKQTSLAINDYNRLLTQFSLDKKDRGEAALALIRAHEDNSDVASAFATLEKYKRLLNTTTLYSLGAKLAKDTGRLKTTEHYLFRVKQQNNTNIPAMYLNGLGSAAYGLAALPIANYNDIKLSSNINNEVVAKKTEALEKLQDNFLSVINFKSPQWTVLACFRLYEINNEYAHFLETAPLPNDFSPEEKQQYKQLIAEKALEYKNEATQYLQTGKALAQRVKPFDLAISTYNAETGTTSGQNRSFIQQSRQQQVGLEALKDKEFRELHDTLFKDPENLSVLLKLAKTYQKRGDYGQAMVIAKNMLADERKLGRKGRAEVYALMGSIYMVFGEDVLARDVLEKALDIDTSNYAAAVNLAGLYRHYGYTDHANGIYSKRVGLKRKDDESLIHARAEGFFNAP